MQISNVNTSFPNTVAPFTSAAKPPSSGVTDDIVVSSFSPLSEISALSSSQNRLSENTFVYTPESLVKSSSSAVSANVNDSASAQPVVQGSESDVVDNNAGNIERVAPQGTGQSVQPDSGSDVGSIAGPVGGDVVPAGVLAPGSSADEQEKSTPGSITPPPSESVGLDPEELEVISKLAARDREVRAHEQQHQAAGGQFAGSASFSYQTGPDGVQYAVGGEVSIDISVVANNPQATIEKMRTVRNAALAPAEPSTQDRSVAAAATRIMLQAQSDLANQQVEAREMQSQRAQQSREIAAEERAEQQEDQKERRASKSEGVRTYESLIGLGQRFENGLTPSINLSEVV